MGRACQKMRVFPLVTAVLLAVIPAVSASLIVMPPLAGKSGPGKLLIVINGAYVKNTNYQEVSEAIQHASSTRLWIAIPSFIASCPNPGEMNSKLADAVATVKQRNFTNMQPARDVSIGCGQWWVCGSDPLRLIPDHPVQVQPENVQV